MRSREAQFDESRQPAGGSPAGGQSIPMLAGGNQMMVRLMRQHEAVSVQRDVGMPGQELQPAVSGPPLPLRAIIPSVNYYQHRYKDFVRRNPGKTPPDYYLGYGDLYAHRFTEELKPRLSDVGKEWVDEALRLIQTYIEDRRDADPDAFAALELRSDELGDFIFSVHPEAYLNAGLTKLPPSDLWKISKTPNFEHLFSWASVKQMIITGAGYYEESRGAKEGVPQM